MENKNYSIHWSYTEHHGDYVHFYENSPDVYFLMKAMAELSQHVFVRFVVSRVVKNSSHQLQA